MQKVVLRDTQIILPTTAKLFGALGLGATGFFTAALMVPYLPPGTRIDGLAMTATSLGMMIGWGVIGITPGKGTARAVGRGINAAVYLAVATLTFLGVLQMVRQMWRGRYDGPMDALVDVIAQGLHFADDVLQADVLAVLFCGAMLSAMLAEWAWKRWQ